MKKLAYLLFCLFNVGNSIHSNQVKPVDLEPITIIATRSEKSSLDTAGSDTAVSTEDMERTGALDLSDALRYEPGVSVPFDFGGTDPLIPFRAGGEKSITIRGIGGNRISLTVDGIRQPEDFSTAGTGSSVGGPGRIYFDPGILSQVELFKTASSSLYGSDAMGGSIQGRTVSPQTLLGDALQGKALRNTFTVNSVNDSVNNRLAAAIGNGKLAHSVVLVVRDGHEQKIHGDAPTNSEDFDSQSILYKSLYNAENWSLEGTVDLFDYENFADLVTIAGDFNNKVTHESRRERQRFSLKGDIFESAELKFADTLTVNAYYQQSSQLSENIQYRVTNDETWYRDISYYTDIYGLDLQANKEIDSQWGLHSVRYGIESSLSDIESGYFLTKLLSDGSTLEEDRIGMAPAESFRYGMFLLDEIELGDSKKWVVTPSIRMDHYKVTPQESAAFQQRAGSRGFRPVEYENTVWAAPGLSLLYRSTPDINYYFTYNHGIRNPSAGELNGYFEHTVAGNNFIISPNPDLQEETSDSFEIGIQASGPSHALQLAAYSNHYEGFIDLQTVAGPIFNELYNANLGSARIQGLEFKGDWIFEEAFSSTGAWQTGFSTSWAEGENTDTGASLNAVNPWTTVGYIGYAEEQNRWGSRLTGTYYGEKKLEDIDQIEGTPIPVEDSFILDLTGWYKISNNWELRGGLNNLTDEKYVLWSDSSRSGCHGSSSRFDHTSQPGINGFVAITTEF